MKQIFNKTILLGSLAVGLAAILWSLDGVFIRPRFYQFPAALIVFLEHLFGFLLLSIFLFKDWASVKAMKRTNWIALFWISLFGGLLGTLFITKAFFAAFDGNITFATVIILQKLQSVFALLLARLLLGEKLRPNFYLWASFAIVSAYFIAFGKHGFNPVDLNFANSAAFFALFAAFAFGSSTVFGKKIVTNIPFSTAASLRFGLTTILALFYIFLTGDITKLGSLEGVHWLLLVAVVFSSGAIALFIYYFGLKRIPASFATLFELFWPVSAITLDYFINKNSLTLTQIVAVVVLLFSLFQILEIKNPLGRKQNM